MERSLRCHNSFLFFFFFFFGGGAAPTVSAVPECVPCILVSGRAAQSALTTLSFRLESCGKRWGYNLRTEIHSCDSDCGRNYCSSM